MNKYTLALAVCLLGVAGNASAQDMETMMQMSGFSMADLEGVEMCDSRNPSSWRDAQTIEGIQIEEDASCEPDMPSLIAAAVNGTNNVSTETLNATGLAPDAVVKGEDKDGDGDPDVIHIKLEIVGLNEGVDSLTPFEIAPGISPGFWVFVPKSTGMATENMSAAHLMRMPSPTIRVEQGDEIKLTIENTHYMRHTVHLHGVDHSYLDAEGEGNDGVPITSEKPIQPGESRTYDITPRQAGSMAYHCHVKPDVHVLMGLSGLFVIEENRPNNTLQTLNLGDGKVRYRSAASRAAYDGEYDLHYQDMDKEMHQMVQGTNDAEEVLRRTEHEYDITERTADYFLLNGRSFPYTLRDSQLIVDPNQQYLLRILNIGSETLSLHTHGHKMNVIALDGVSLSPGARFYRDVLDIHAAQRADVILDTTDDGLNSYGPGVWLFHDHEETHITTDGVSPGGDLSMITYRSFVDEEGMPVTQGMDLRQFFLPEYYYREGKMAANMVMEKESVQQLILLSLVIIIGAGLGFFGSRVVMGTKRRKTPTERGSANIHSMFLTTLFFVFAFFLASVLTVSAQGTDPTDLSGIHIMPNGDVMLGSGDVVGEASVTADGMIRLPSGTLVSPVLDMRTDMSAGVEEEPEPVPADPVLIPQPDPEPEPETMNDMDMDMDMGAGEVATEASHLGMEGMDGIHIMPNGRVMTGAGVWLNDATVTAEGMIMLGSGEAVTPILDMRSGGGIRRSESSMVVNENFDKLPFGCTEIAGEKSIKVVAGAEIAADFPGTVFTYDTHSIEGIEPCTLLTVTFENKDHVRHQFMVHDLPTDTYPMGMFNIEVTGPGEETGTFITPPDSDTLFVHCGVPEHEAKGMVAQIKNGRGDGDLDGIPGISWDRDGEERESVVPDGKKLAVWGGAGAGVGVLAFLFGFAVRRQESTEL